MNDKQALLRAIDEYAEAKAQLDYANDQLNGKDVTRAEKEFALAKAAMRAALGIEEEKPALQLSIQASRLFTAFETAAQHRYLYGPGESPDAVETQYGQTRISLRAYILNLELQMEKAK